MSQGGWIPTDGYVGETPKTIPHTNNIENYRYISLNYQCLNYLSIYLPTYLPIYLPIYLSVRPSVSICPSLSIYPSIHLPIDLSMNQFPNQSLIFLNSLGSENHYPMQQQAAPFEVNNNIFQQPQVAVKWRIHRTATISTVAASNLSISAQWSDDDLQKFVEWQTSFDGFTMEYV